MPRFLPVGKSVKGAAGFLLAAIPALGAVLTALAITGDLIGRMARDHPLASYAAFGFAVLAIFAGAAAAFALRDGSTQEQLAIFTPASASSRRASSSRSTRVSRLGAIARSRASP